MQAAQNLIKQLGRHIGLDELELDGSGQCTLAFDETIVLTFVADQEEGLNVVSFVGDLSDDNASAATLLLAHNFVPSALGGGRVALEPDSNRVVLVGRWNGVTTDFQTFTQLLEAFVNGVEAVREDLARGKPTNTRQTAVRREDIPPPGAFA